ncbi:MAG: hypothetical protein WDZ52_12715 [Pseudohongiellaceae bacterium]
MSDGPKLVAISLLAAVLVLPVNHSWAQHSGCSEPQFRAFDFWLGEWEVTDNVSGKVAGSNSIQKMEGGCMLLESWQGAEGSTGTSVNYYNPEQGQWRQLWISQGRYSIDIAGGMLAEEMQLVGNIYPFNGSAARFRGTWTPNADGSVRQFFEQYNDDTRSWDVWFDGRYLRKDN